LDEWKLPWEGGCRCGAVRIQISAPPLLTGVCHCTGCQKMSASAFSLTVSVPSEGFAVTAGSPVIGGLRGPDSHHHHCDACKSWMFTTVEGLDFFVNVRASMLDHHDWVVPFIETWTSEKMRWAETGAPHSFETVPELPAFQPLIEAFALEGARP